MATDYDDLRELLPGLSPIATSGVDPDEVLASGDPQRFLAQRAGMTQGATPPPMPNELSMLAQAGGPGTNTPVPSGSSATQTPATNAPNPTSETTRTPAVPGTVTPSGSPTSPTSAFARPTAAPDPNAIESRLVSAQAPLTAQNPTGAPIQRDPNHPEYMPSAGRRIARGVISSLEGLAQGGIRGAVVGALDPAKVGATPYGAGTRQFSAAAQRNANLQQSLEQQLGQTATNAKIALEQTQAEAGKLITITPAQAQAMGNPALAGTSVTQKSLDDLTRNANTVQGRKDVATMNNATKEEIAAANNLTKKDVASLKPEQRDDRAIRLMEKPPDQRTQEENAYLGAYSKWVNQTKTQPGIARAMVFAQYRPVQTIDADGNVHYDYSGHAIQSGASAPASIPFQTARSVAKAFTSGPQASQLTAFRTATDHLQLMKRAADALHNGDIQGLNRLSNEFQTQIGKPAPTNAKALAEMLSGELASVLSKGGATVSEIDEMRKQINANAQSPDQMSGIIDTNQNVINEKANELLQQYIAGESGQPVFEPLSQGGTNPLQTPKTPAAPNSRFTPKSGNTPPPAAGMIRALDDKGVLHEAPKGTALPKGWKLQ